MKLSIISASDRDNEKKAILKRISKILTLPPKPFSSLLFKIPEGETPQLILHPTSKAVYESRNTEKYTCSNCSVHEICPYAYDSYNTDGDCLADK